MARFASIIRHESTDRNNAGHEATLFTTSNGYLAVRGTHPERPDGLAATYLAGVFTDDGLGFRTLASCGDVLGIKLRANGKALHPWHRAVVHFERVFDLNRYIVTRTITWQVSSRARVTATTEHTCSLADRRVVLQRYQVRAEGAAVDIHLTAEATLRAKTRGEHLLTGFRSAESSDGTTTTAQTRAGDYRIAQHACVTVVGARGPECRTGRAGAHWTLQTKLRPGRPITLAKFVAFAADRDAGSDFAAVAARAGQAAARHGFERMCKRHAGAWRRLWRDCDIRIEGDDENLLGLRYTVAQLMAHTPRDDDRAGLAAKPLCAEGYRGHVFWDTDLFMTPAVTALRPDLGRHLANYRYEMLEGARRNAAKWNYAGAWYPWESADDGTEVTAAYWLHADGRRMPITCWKHEIHSVCDVAYAAWDFYRATGDRDWLLSKGVEILVETARYWASRSLYNRRERRYEIHDVCGPDEGHERTNNCAYINVLAAWNIDRALVALNLLRNDRPAAYRTFCERLRLDDEEQAGLRGVGAQMYIPQDTKTGWYRQFDGFEDLLFVDPATVQERYEEPPDAEETQAVKQADVVMLLHLFRDRLSREQMLVNWDYYVPRTVHNTSLSAATHAAVAARIGLVETARRYFTQAANMDRKNWRGDSDRGLHGAAMGGAICAVVFGFGGLVFHEDHLGVDPILPAGWRRLRIPFTYQGRKLLLDVTPAGFDLRFREPGPGVAVVSAGQRCRLTPGRPLRGKLAPVFRTRRTLQAGQR